MRPLAHRTLVVAVVSAAGCVTSPPTSTYETLPQGVYRDCLTAQKFNSEGLAAIEEDDLDAAAEAFRRALEADLWYAPAHNNLGLTLLKQGQAYPAAWEFHYAAKLMPHSACPLNNLGLVMERVGRLDEAIGFYTESLELSPDNIEVMGHLARAYVKSDRKDAEARHLLEALAYRGTEGWDLWAREQLIGWDR